MTFNSLDYFLFFFVLVVVYGFVREKDRWKLLLAASILFYAFSGVYGLICVAFSAATTYFGAVYLEKKKSKWVLALTLLANFGVLFVIKYFNFFAGIVSAHAFSGFAFILPLGISFYTFQLTGYVIDVYRGQAAQKNFAKLLLFGMFFPQMVTGPINRYADIAPTLYHPQSVDYQRCRSALVLFAWGLFKKICVADNIKAYVDIIYGNYQQYHGLLILSGAVAYAIYIYADFSGCIDMARGTACYFGVDLAENFRLPYFSLSVDEFWRRWHMSLNNWFRDYLFYPLLRSRWSVRLARKLRKSGRKKLSSVLPATMALLAVWLVTGLWHGADYTYVAWGLYYGVIMTAITWRKEYRRKKKTDTGESAWKKGLRMLSTFLIVCVGYIIFNAPSMTAAFGMLANLFSLRSFVEINKVLVVGVTFYKEVGAMPYFLITVASVVVLIVHDVLQACHVDAAGWMRRKSVALKYVCACLAVFFLLFMMNRTSGDFTYMQF